MSGTSLALVVDNKPAPKARNLALYDLEEHLQCLLDSEETVPPELESEYDLALREAVIQTVAKRDAVGQFMAHCESQIAFAESEIKRLQDRKAHFERTFERVEGCVIRTILSLDIDAKGKYRKLEGNTACFSVRKCPVSVEVTDESAVPAEYKSMPITLPVVEWEALLDSLDFDHRERLLSVAKRGAIAVSKTAIKAALEEGPMAGAHLVTDKLSLVRK